MALEYLKKIDSTKLFEVCKQHIFDCLGNIFTEKEITDYFYKNAPKDLPSIQSKITIETPDLLIERYSRKLNFLYKTIIPTINKYDDVTFFILLRLCDFNPLHIGLFYPFFETAINSREVSDNLKNQLPNNPLIILNIILSKSWMLMQIKIKGLISKI